jgi:hypothetical protein
MASERYNPDMPDNVSIFPLNKEPDHYANFPNSQQADINFSIFESEPNASHYRPREWSMAIHWALPQLEALLPSDLKARLKEAQNDPFLDAPEQDVMKIWNGKDGTVLKELPIPRTIRVSRRKMRAFCAQGTDIKVSAARDYKNNG